MAGKLQSQKIKKLTQSLVLVPFPFGMLLGTVSQLLQMLRIMRYTQVPGKEVRLRFGVPTLPQLDA